MVVKQRYRPITFRVHSDEYEILMKACVSSGARSVSDFARTAVLQRAQQGQNEQHGTLSGDLATLSDRLGKLDSSLEEMKCVEESGCTGLIRLHG